MSRPNSATINSDTDGKTVVISSNDRAYVCSKPRTRLEHVLLGVVILLVLIVATLVAAIAYLAITASSKTDLCFDKECINTAAQLLKSLNTSIHPCDDFYELSCGGWKSSNPKSSGNFEQLETLVQERIKDFLNEDTGNRTSKSTAIEKARIMYKACVNETSTEEQGLPLLRAVLNKYGGWPMTGSGDQRQQFESKPLFTDPLDIAADIRNYGDSYLIGVDIIHDIKNTDNYIIGLDQPVMGIDRSFLIATDKFDEALNAYKTYIVKAAMLVSQLKKPDAEKLADDIISMEKRFARWCLPPEFRRNVSHTYNRMTVGDLSSKVAQNINWLRYLNTVFKSIVQVTSDTEVVVSDVSYVGNLSLFLAEPNKQQILVNYLNWMSVKAMAPHSAKVLQDLDFEYQKAIKGISERDERPTSCAEWVNDAMGFAVGSLFVKHYYSNNIQKQVEEMVENIRSAFMDAIRQSDWMDETTKLTAIEKANSMRFFIGYPKWILDRDKLDTYYETINVTRESHFENVMKVRMADSHRNLEKLAKPVDRNEWITAPTVVNAFYLAEVNSIYVPAAILLEPFFSLERPAAVNYGSIGVIIGHEIGHAFDDEGRQYDKSGNVHNWWTETSEVGYMERAKCIRDQYSSYCPEELASLTQSAKVNRTTDERSGVKFKNSTKTCINGAVTLGENIADIGGLKQAYAAYLAWTGLHGEEMLLPGLQQYSMRQIYFLSFAHLWCGNFNRAELLDEILNDSHSPNKYRVWGSVANSYSFSKEFGCATGPMNRGDSRCHLW